MCSVLRLLSSWLMQFCDKMFGVKNMTVTVMAVRTQHSMILIMGVFRYLFRIALISELMYMKKDPRRPPKTPRITKNGKS